MDLFRQEWVEKVIDDQDYISIDLKSSLSEEPKLTAFITSLETRETKFTCG